MKKLSLFALLLSLSAAAASAQPRPVSGALEKSSDRKVAPAPQSFSARYEGGFLGFNKRREGTLRFDDIGERLVFFDEKGKELFWFPYRSLLAVYGDQKSVTSTTGNVIRVIPLPGAGLGGFIKEKRRFLVLQFEDPDTGGNGVCSFRTDNAELLESVIHTLAEKANLVQRGDAFYRPRSAEKQSN